MKCNDVIERLSPYIDEVLEEEEMKEITDHLAKCDSCGKIYQDLLDMIQQLSAVEEVELPDSFEFRLKRALSEERKSKGKARINWRFASSIAAVLVIGLLTYGMYGDMLQILPDKLGQSDSTSLSKEESALPSQLSEEETPSQYNIATMDAAEEDSAIQEEAFADDSVSLQRQAASLALVPPVKEESAVNQEADLQDSQYGMKNNVIEPLSIPDYTCGPTRHMQKKKEQVLDGEGQSLENQGLMRDSAAVRYYNNLIAEKLTDFDYEIFDCTYEANGEWHFKAVIFQDAEGNTYNAEVLITGKDGEITFKSEEEIKGL